MRAIACAIVIFLLVLGSGLQAGEADWNDAEIDWKGYEEGLSAASESGRPVCLVFYTTWCPHCTNYAKVFGDSEVVEKSKSFVMIRLDKDKNREVSRKYSPDGEYIPRTYFLGSDGVLDATITETREKFKYFYNENKPGAILSGMERALAKLGN